jgi:hypothetical protein
VGNVLTWARRLKLWAPLTRSEVEQVRFDTQAIQNPEIDGTEYQRGTLFGWELQVLGVPIGLWTGGRTRWNRDRFGIEKAHCLDALCVGELAGVSVHQLRVLHISAMGRGSHCRTNVHENGFPRGYLTRQKRIQGFATGDLVKAVVPKPLKTAGVHTGRVAVRASASFRVGKTDGINVKYCQLLQRADGYQYA